jgi:ABC-type branched-subunit amino acid transport system ATPase component
VHRRYRVGLGRGFQSARLYPDLTVRETIMVALEARQRSLVGPSIL